MWQRIIHRIQDFFSVSPKEARGIAVLLLLSGLMLCAPVFLKRYLLYRSPAEKAQEKAFLDSLIHAVAQNQPTSFPNHQPVITSQTENPTLKQFDPNTAPENELAELGIPIFLVKRIVNYRNRGGVFRRKEDLKHIYDFPEELYMTLHPYIFITVPEPLPEQRNLHPVKESDKRHTASPYFDKPNRTEGIPELKRSKSITIPFDINTADTTLLKTIKGIGSRRANTIFNYRQALGGFYSETQYAEIYGLDSTSLDGLLRYAKILSPHKRIPLNTVSEEIFLQHPYAKANRRLSSAIIRYREQHGSFSKAEDLQNVVPLSSDYLDRLIPYLQFD